MEENECRPLRLRRAELRCAVSLMRLCDTIRGKLGVDYDAALKKFAKR